MQASTYTRKYLYYYKIILHFVILNKVTLLVELSLYKNDFYSNKL